MINKTIFLTVGILFVIIMIAGCEEQNLSDTNLSPKKTRIIAVENMRLKEQLQKRDVIIENQKAQFAKQKEQLKKCKDENKALKTTSHKEIESLILDALRNPTKETTK